MICCVFHTTHVETVVLIFHKKPDGHINVKVEFGEGKVPLDNILRKEGNLLMENFDIVNEIYNEIFCNIQHGNIDLFLCGAASTKEKTSYRDIIRGKLEDIANLLILYPEDMFMEMLNRKKYDLLTLEKFLASNSDIILIVCESPGSFTELGAFVNNGETLEKVVVLLQTKYKNAKSFIRQGPIEYVRMKNKNNVIYFNNNIDEAVEKIKKYLKNRFWYLGYKRKEPKLKDLNLISGQYYFIVVLLSRIKCKDIGSGSKGFI